MYVTNCVTFVLRGFDTKNSHWLNESIMFISLATSITVVGIVAMTK